MSARTFIKKQRPCFFFLLVILYSQLNYKKLNTGQWTTGQVSDKYRVAKFCFNFKKNLKFCAFLISFVSYSYLVGQHIHRKIGTRKAIIRYMKISSIILLGFALYG